MNKLLVGLGVVVLAGALLVAGLAVSKPTNITVELPSNLGNASPFHDFPEFFNLGAFRKGSPDQDRAIPTVVSPSSASTLTVSSSQICDNNVVRINFTTATGTVTLPSAANFTSNGTCLANLGDAHEFMFQSANDVANGTTTITAGASSTLFHLSLNSSANASTTLFGSSTSVLKGVRVQREDGQRILWAVFNLD